MSVAGNHYGPGSDFPDYLQSYDALREHFESHLAHLSPSEKGRRFAHFVQKLVPQTDIGSEFEAPSLSPTETNDDGVDMTGRGKDGQSMLYVQAKLSIARSDSIDTILSKFLAHRNKQRPDGQSYLFDPDEGAAHYLIITLSSLERIIHKYVERRFATFDFYQQHQGDRRLHIVDGPQIWVLLRSAFTKMQGIATNVELNLETPVISQGNVFFGIISSTELQNLYKKFGDALFFENIRDFLELGRTQEREGRTTVNSEIIRTIKEHPDKMIERNNGIAFRAETVSVAQSGRRLILSSGSIVNGCQTTMCIVENADKPCHVPDKDRSNERFLGHCKGCELSKSS